MKYRTLGNTGMEVSELAFGGVEIGLPYGIGAKTNEDMPGEKEAIALLHSGLEKGINFFDTARLYGGSERIMGKAFKGIRKEVLIATKCRHLRDIDGKLPEDAALESFIRNSLEESLRWLQTDYVDLYMLHYADLEILENPVIAAVFCKLKKQGWVRAIGVSVYKPLETAKTLEVKTWDAVQLPFNLMDQSHAAYFDQAVQNGLGIIIRSVLMRGMLRDEPLQLHPEIAHVAQHIDAFRAMLDANYESLPHLAMKFVLAHQQVSSMLLGIDKETYLTHAMEALAKPDMPGTLWKKLVGMHFPDPEGLNLAEWDKKGWL